jgi:hypothetical protein
MLQYVTCRSLYQHHSIFHSVIHVDQCINTYYNIVCVTCRSVYILLSLLHSVTCRSVFQLNYIHSVLHVDLCIYLFYTSPCYLFYTTLCVVRVLVVILSIITALDLTEEWFMFWLLYCLPLLSKVWQRGSSCCGCYIVYHYCLKCSCFGCYIVYHYCLRFYKGVVHVVVVILHTITV